MLRRSFLKFGIAGLAAPNLILRSAETYFTVLRAQDNLATSKAEEAAFRRQLDQATERFDVGLSDKTDVLEAQASFDTAKANPIARCGYSDYAEVSELFSIVRPAGG